MPLLRRAQFAFLHALFLGPLLWLSQTVLAASVGDDRPVGQAASSLVSADRPGQDMAYPVGDVFRPLLADPRQPRFFVSLREVDMPAERMTTVAVGFGETFGL